MEPFTLHFLLVLILGLFCNVQGKVNVYTQFSLTILPVDFYVVLSDKLLAVISAIGVQGR
jgi:hypothetical protein